MASLTMSGAGSADGIAAILQDEVQRSALSCELVNGVARAIGAVRVHVMVFEKYYMRSGNRASLTVVVTGDDSGVTVDAFGSGGGQGVFHRFSWGAEENFVGVVEDILRRQGFR